MQRRKQSVTTVSFAAAGEPRRAHFHRPEDKVSPGSPGVFPSPPPEKDGDGDSLLHVCREIAGALMRRYLETGSAAETRREIVVHFENLASCGRARANLLVDLAIELLRVEAYGEYRRDPLELSLLITRAAGGVEDVGLN